MPPPLDPTVAIVGAGLTGLLAAHGLIKNGFRVAVFDAEPHMNARLRDWTLVLHWALPVMKTLLPDAIVDRMMVEAVCNPFLFQPDAMDARSAQDTTEIESLVVYSNVSGERLFASPMPGSRRIARQRLRRVLADGIDIQWGKELKTLARHGSEDKDKALTLGFADGSFFEADFVLGTDGARSAVRKLLVGINKAQSTRSGLMFATGITQLRDVAKVQHVVDLHPVAAVSMGGSVVGGVGLMHADDPDMATWLITWIKIWQGSMGRLDGKAALDFVRAQDPKLNLCPSMQQVIDWTPDNADCYIDEMRYWVPIPLDTLGGRVGLAGDAAHPMLIYRGQGYQHAITDVRNFVDALNRIRDASWDGAVRQKEIDAFAADVVERGAAAVKQSVSEAALSFDEAKVATMLMARKGHGKSA